MADNKPYYRWQGESLLLFCHLQPKASSNAFVGPYGERLKIRISATPTDGKANDQLKKFIAKNFGISKTAITIDSGEFSRQKNLLIQKPSTLPSELNIQPL